MLSNVQRQLNQKSVVHHADHIHRRFHPAQNRMLIFILLLDSQEVDLRFLDQEVPRRRLMGQFIHGVQQLIQ